MQFVIQKLSNKENKKTSLVTVMVNEYFGTIFLYQELFPFLYH